MIELLILFVFPAGMAMAAALDFFTMTISNKLALALLAGFVVLAASVGLPLEEVIRHAGAGLAMLAIGFAMFAVGWVGGGDAKLFAVTALWLGWGHLLEYAVLLSLCGGALTLALLFVRRLPLPHVLCEADWAVRLHHPRGDIPYGIALAAAGLMIYPHTFWMARLTG